MRTVFAVRFTFALHNIYLIVIRKIPDITEAYLKVFVPSNNGIKYTMMNTF